MKYFTKTASKFDFIKIMKANPELAKMSLQDARQFGSALDELKMLDDLGNIDPMLLKHLNTSASESKAVKTIGGKIALASINNIDNFTAELEANTYLDKVGIARKRKDNFGPSGNQVNSGTNVDSSGSRSNAVPVPVVDPAKPAKPINNGGISDPEQPKPVDPAQKPDVTPGKSMNESWVGTLSDAMSSGQPAANNSSGSKAATNPKPSAPGAAAAPGGK